MRKVVLGLDEDGIVNLATAQARLFQALAEQQPETDWVFQYSPEMFSGTELTFAKRVVDAVTGVWQPTPARKCIVNLPSTVEHSTPNIFADMIEWMHRNLARRDGGFPEAKVLKQRVRDQIDPQRDLGHNDRP